VSVVLQSSSLLLLVVRHGGKAVYITHALCKPGSLKISHCGRPSLSRAVMPIAKGGNSHAITKGVVLFGRSFSTGHPSAGCPGRLFNSPLPSPHPSSFSEPASVYYPAQCVRPVKDPSAPPGGRPSFPFIVAQCSNSCLVEVAVFGWYCPFCQSFLYQSPPTNWPFCLSLPFAFPFFIYVNRLKVKSVLRFNGQGIKLLWVKG